MVSLDSNGHERETTEEVFQNFRSKSPATNREPTTTNHGMPKRSYSSRRNSHEGQQSSIVKLSQFTSSGVDSRTMKKTQTKIVFFDRASPKPAATSMMLYTTEEDLLDKEAHFIKESPLKSI